MTIPIIGLQGLRRLASAALRFVAANSTKILAGAAVAGGVGTVAAGTATIVLINRMKIRDAQLKQLAEQLKKANELYEAARRVTEKQEAEIAELNKIILEILRSKKKNQEQLESLEARLRVLIEQLRKAA